MAGMKISDLDFIRLLPVFMRDDEAAIALSKAVNELIGIPSRRIPTIRTWDEIDNLTEAECDEMAWELDVDWYDQSYSLQVKRNLIKNALNVKRIAGTKEAVLNVLKGILGNAQVEEWFQYNGTPYHFKVRTDAVLDEDMATYFWEIIKKIKNVRSHIEVLEIERHTEHTIFSGCGLFAVYHPAAIIDGYETQAETLQDINTGVAGITRHRPAAILQS